MKLDESNIYTLANADKVKSGSMGFFGNTLDQLYSRIENRDTHVLSCVLETSFEHRFETCEPRRYALFYPVEKLEKKFRPYEGIYEMLNDFSKRARINCKIINPPQIYLKEKIDKTNYIYLITIFSSNQVWMGGVNYSLDELFDNFTYLDGSPCGVEE